MAKAKASPAPIETLPPPPPEHAVIRRASIREQKRYATRPLMILDVDEVAANLACSSCCRDWVTARLKEALLAGQSFVVKDQEDGSVLATYELATPEDVIGAASRGVKKGKIGEERLKRSTENEPVYVFNFPAAKERAESFARDGMTKQGRVLLEIIAESGQTRLNMSALEAVLETGRARVGAKEGRSLIGLFKSHFGWTYERFGFVKREDPAPSKEDDDE
jgi:hypothetical protein